MRVHQIAALTLLFLASLLSPPNIKAEATAAGVQGYSGLCAPCHGLSGTGHGPWSRDLQGSQPRDFTRGLFQFRSTEDRVRLEDLIRTIQNGMPGTEMPAFRGLLDDAQAGAIAEVVLQFSDRGKSEPPGTPLVIPAPPTSPAESAARGKILFQDDCTGCHGPQGRGDGPKAAELLDAWKRPVRPKDLARDAFEGGSTSTDIYRTLATGMDGIPMPPYGFLLEPEELWDLTNYVQSLRQKRTLRQRIFGSDALDPTRTRAKARKRKASPAAHKGID